MKTINKIRNIKPKFSTSIKRKKNRKQENQGENIWKKTHENINFKTLKKHILRKPKKTRGNKKVIFSFNYRK
jgi:hypothetical protein